jgi:dolichol-phosphate mannosyltransferase
VGAVLSALPGGPHEVVLVDDGSTDATRVRLIEAAKRDPRLVVVILSRNFGHQPALTAALDIVSGDVIIAMDGDLQDPPEAIPTFLSHYQQGYDVVYARRLRRKEGLFLRMSYWAYYRLATRISAIELPVDAGDFGLMSARVVLELRAMRERHRYLRGLRAWVGFRQVGVLIERGARLEGITKYTPLRLLKLASDGLFAFSTLPLRMAAVVGAVALLSSSAFALYSIVAKFIFPSIPRGFTATIVIATFLSGVNLLFLGVIGEYVGRIYEELKERPIYIIDRIVRDGIVGEPSAADNDMLLSTDQVGG